MEIQRQHQHDFKADLETAIRKGLRHSISLQGEDGAWRSRYGGPGFLTPMYVLGLYVAGKQPSDSVRGGIVRYLSSVQNRDGSLGLHEEGEGCMFTTVLGYLSLRLLGVPKDEPAATAMRDWILANGTALGAASWGKFWLSLLNLYPHEGLNPILPELWLLPYSAPFHPGRMWCHSRQVYLPMAYLYAIRAATPENDLIRDLRREIYDRPYDAIPFADHRDTVAPCDNLIPVTPSLKVANRLLLSYERKHAPSLRKRALAEILRHIDYEDRATDFIDIGPVNSILNAIVRRFQAPGSDEEKRSFERLNDYLCETEQGVHFNGYNSTALWDTTFFVHAMLASGQTDVCREALSKAHAFIDDNQIREDPPDRERHYRHASIGGWPFSDREHGWPISDCTAEGLRCAFALQNLVDAPIPESRLEESVRLILSLQNGDGGWASYERRRGSDWLERFNPSQVFADIMVEHSYVECSAACVQALVKAKGRFGGGLGREIDQAISRGAAFIKRKQRPDGSWYGSWAICFTYATWFAVSGLVAAGRPANAPEIRKAAGFLIQRQNRDGGWGEHYRNCLEERWIPGQKSHSVQTAWALMTLVNAGLAHTEAARRAARFLVERQLETGDWPREALTGMFNKSTAIDYDNYRRAFPVMALSLVRNGCD
ncbi:MAG: squalene--hopene cyclase [Myxococcales bacterium]|nr:MAG: squalene--hopene cyclase [Myxococcales bacterium]